MKKRSGISLAVKLIFILSLCVMLYSAVQIFKAPAEARKALQTWEKKREEAQPSPATEEETPLPDGMISPQQNKAASTPNIRRGGYWRDLFSKAGQTGGYSGGDGTDSPKKRGRA